MANVLASTADRYERPPHAVGNSEQENVERGATSMKNGGACQSGAAEPSKVEPVAPRDAHSKPPTLIWRAAPLAVFALSSLGIGAVASRSAGGYPAPPFFHLFFSDTIHMKAWLATGAIILALFQILTAARMFELVHCPPAGRFWGSVHRISGYLAILLTLPVAYHCIFLLGFETTSVRVAIHSLLGSTVYGAFLGKMIVVRSGRFPGWALPVAGALLFTILVGLWLTSSLYLFSTTPITL
jgi:hypothetical protein